MSSTIYADFDKETQRYLGVSDGLIRISVGLEDPVVIANDFIEATKF